MLRKNGISRIADPREELFREIKPFVPFQPQVHHGFFRYSNVSIVVMAAGTARIRFVPSPA